MIAINFTVFVELGLFLLFMWVTQRLILGPILSVMDRRDDQERTDKKTAAERTAEAKSLEQRYANDVAKMRRRASAAIEKARRDGMIARAAAIRERKAKADGEVRVIQDATDAALASERLRFDALVPGLAEHMANQLRLRGDA